MKHVILVLLFLAGFGCVGAGVWGLTALEELTEDYVPVTAKVLNVETIRKYHRKRPHYEYKASIEFPVKGRTYRSVVESTLLMLDMDGEIAIVYNPKNPYDLYAIHYDRLSFGALIVFGLLTGGAGWLYMSKQRLKSETDER